MISQISNTPVIPSILRTCSRLLLRIPPGILPENFSGNLPEFSPETPSQIPLALLLRIYPEFLRDFQSSFIRFFFSDNLKGFFQRFFSVSSVSLPKHRFKIPSRVFIRTFSGIVAGVRPNVITAISSSVPSVFGLQPWFLPGILPKIFLGIPFAII